MLDVRSRVALELWRQDLERLALPSTLESLNLANHYDPSRLYERADKVIRALRDLPHAVLDAARGNRMASGDAAVLWNNVIDHLTQTDGTGAGSGVREDGLDDGADVLHRPKTPAGG